MKIAETLLLDFDSEIAGARKTLERVPETLPDYKPHDKSMALGKLAMHVAHLPMFGTLILTTPSFDMAVEKLSNPPLIFTGREALLAGLDSSAKELRDVLASASDETMHAKWRFSFGEHVIMDVSRAETYRRMFFNHMIHHRAQLGVYLRLNDLAVPGLYGPSADEPF